MNVLERSSVASLLRCMVAEPASARVHTRQNDDLVHLASYAVQPVFSGCLGAVSTSPHSYYIAYRKTPGIQCLRVEVEVHNSVSLGTMPDLTCEVTVPGASTNWIEIGGGLFLDGSQGLGTETPSTHDTSRWANFLDVSALTDGTYYDLKFLVTDGGTGLTFGLYRITVTEVPLSTVDPVGSPTTETGVNPAWLQSTDRNLIVDGTASSISYGQLRLLNQLEIARYQKRRHIQIVKPEATTLAFNITSTAAIGAGGTEWPSTPLFYVRSRALYGTSTANTYVMRVRYINSDATNKCTIRVAVTPVGGAATNTDYVLPNKTSFGSSILDNGGAMMSISIPGTGTNQECTIALYATNDTGGQTTQVSQVAFIEGES